MPYSKRTRRFLIRRFSYLVIFLELADKILIVAVAHGKRRPVTGIIASDFELQIARITGASAH